MKKIITRLFVRATGAALLAFAALTPGSALAQWCNATSYGYGNQYGGNITAIEVSNAGGTLAAYSGLGDNTTQSLLNTGAPFDITSGEFLTVKLTGNADQYGYGWGTYAGVWIDGNRDGDFSDAGECVADPQGGPFSNITNQTVSAQVQVPCTNSAGKTRMRFRGNFTYYSAYLTKTNACGNPGVYGNQFDLEVNIKLGTSPVASFTPPTGPNYEKSNITFNADNPNSYFKYIWDFNPPGTAGSGSPATATGAKAKSKWSSAGNYDVKLTVDYCGVKDSMTKLVKVIQPSAVPKADFIASSNLVEIYYDVQLFDLSTNGAYMWTWELTSPTGNVYGPGDRGELSSQNPITNMDEEGKWDICLTSENSLGPSTKVCKSKYVECTPPGEFYLGPNHLATNQKGILYDNGGPTLNYGNNRKVSIDYFKILPCGAKEIRLKFKSLKLADANDKLRIYDGEDESGKLLSPAGGITAANQNTYRTMTLKATSGSMYITFESNGSGNDSGFIAVWESDLLPPKAPVAHWTTDYNPAANGMEVIFEDDVVGAQGNVTYEWILDGNPYMSSQPDFAYTFFTDGSYDVCLRASTCNGDDTFCGTMVITTPQVPGSLDFVASNLRPKVGDVVNITTTTDYANTFEWSIFPTTVQYVNGTSASSKNPEVKFTAGGAYTFTLKAWNSVGGRSLTEKKVIKNKYVIALNYCIPPVDLLSSDIGINMVELSKGGNVLLSNESTSGDFAYTDYSESMSATLTFGAAYDLAISRKTNSNTINYKAWIDFNIDGDFDDAGEEILSSGTISGQSTSGSFNVPSLANSFEGISKLRVAASYGTFSNSPCGINIVGEFEDYAVVLANDKQPPVITLVGSDTVRVEKGTSATSCYSEVAGSTYSASDPTEGNMTSKVVVTTDLDCTVPGIYSFEFNLSDASGNKAIPRTRTVIVVLDKTAPVLTLNGTSPMTVEQCDNFTDPGAVATDLVDGNLSTAIIVTGSVNTSVVGSYTLTYSISDAQGNTATATRVVNVVDTKKPGIYKVGNRIVDGTIVKVQINSTFVDDIYAEDVCNGQIAISKIPGFNGPVNTAVRATYPIMYYSQDPSGNKADEDGYVINYQVDDYISPEINLNTEDTIIHDVNNPYYSRSVTVSDNYYPLSKLSVIKNGSVDPYTLGTYEEKYTCTDESGNIAIRSRYVKVVDREAPDMIGGAISTCIGTPFWAMSGLIIRDNYYSPATLLPMVKVINHNVNVWEAGVYFINYELTDPSGNSASMITRTVYVQYPPNCQTTYTGVETLKLADAVSVFPNPSSGKITIGYTLTNSNPLNVEVYNAVGVKVAEVKELKGGFGTQQIDLTTVGSGTYFVRLTNNGESVTRQVIITR